MAAPPNIGGSGKGASGAATIFGDNNSLSGTTLSPLLIGVLAIAALAVVGWLVVSLSKK